MADVCICERNELVEDGDYSLDGRNFQRFLNFLDELGYVAAPSQADRILYDAARRAIERFGQSARIVEFHFIKNGLSKGQDGAYTFSKDT